MTSSSGKTLSELLRIPFVTDVHLRSENGAPSNGWMRIGGSLVFFDGPVVDDLGIVGDVSDFSSRWRPCDESFGASGVGRLRVSKRIFMGGRGREVFLRVLPSRIPCLASALSDILGPVMIPKEGLFLVSGQTGSGKSTLLASLSSHYINPLGSHVVTVEDPVEYELPGGGPGYASQREVGIDTPSFAEGVRMSLREDPDVVVVGEIRDPETARVALSAGETGHMVLATVHAAGCFGAVERYLALVGGDEYNAMRLAHAYIGGVHIRPMYDDGTKGGPVLREYETFWNNDAATTQIRERRTHQLGQSGNFSVSVLRDGETAR